MAARPGTEMLRGQLEDQQKARGPGRDYGKVRRPKPTERFDGRTGNVSPDFNPLLDDVQGVPRYDLVRPQHLVSGMHMTMDQFGGALEKLQADVHLAAAKPWRMKWPKFAEPLLLLLLLLVVVVVVVVVVLLIIF